MRKGQIKLVEKVKKIYGEQNNIVGFFLKTPKCHLTD